MLFDGLRVREQVGAAAILDGTLAARIVF